MDMLPASSTDPITITALPVVHQGPAALAPGQSVWELEQWPSHTKPYEFTPAQLRKALVEYASSATSIINICDAHNIRYKTMLDLEQLYPEVAAAARDAEQAHVELGVRTAEDRIEQAEDVLHLPDGRVQANSASVRKAEAIARHRQWMAERLISKYANTQRMDVRTVNLNANVAIDPATLGSTDVRDLDSWFNNAKR